jgi:uncharacterized protein
MTFSSSSPLPVWLRAQQDGVTLSLAVQPGAKKSAFAGEHGDRLKLKIAAPPVDGAANEEVVEFLARAFGVKRRDVTILHGETSRQKTVFVAGVDAPTVLTFLSR